MKYERSASFIADYTRLNRRERELFSEAVRRMNEAFRGRSRDPLPHSPASLRVKAVRDLSGVLEMTWSFSGPDGRATFEIVDVSGEPAVRWRRIGGHEIFASP